MRATDVSDSGKIAASRAKLESLLVGDPDSPFPRSRTMQMLRGSGPAWLAGIALGLMVVKPRWGVRVMRLVPQDVTAHFGARAGSRPKGVAGR